MPKPLSNSAGFLFFEVGVMLLYVPSSSMFRITRYIGVLYNDLENDDFVLQVISYFFCYAYSCLLGVIRLEYLLNF